MERLEALQKAVEANSLQGKKILNLREAAMFLNMSESRLYKLTSSSQIPHYKPTGKLIYFHREELEEWVLRGKVKTKDDIEDQAQKYINRNKKPWH